MPRSVVPFAVLGSASVVAGGVLSAAAAPAPSYTASWAVAYLVLVGGVAQLVLGFGQGRLAPRPPSARLVAAEAVLFNLANLAVLLGTVAGAALVVDTGAVLLLTALVLFIWAVRGTRSRDRWVLYGFRLMIAIVLVTTPLGLVIAHLRAG